MNFRKLKTKKQVEYRLKQYNNLLENYKEDKTPKKEIDSIENRIYELKWVLGDI